MEATCKTHLFPPLINSIHFSHHLLIINHVVSTVLFVVDINIYQGSQKGLVYVPSMSRYITQWNDEGNYIYLCVHTHRTLKLIFESKNNNSKNG